MKILSLFLIFGITLITYIYYAPINKQLRDLAKIYHCFIMPSYNRYFRLKSKKQFDNFDLTRKIKQIKNLDYLIYKSAYTHQLYEQYIHRVNYLINTTPWIQHPFANHFVKTQTTKTWHIIYSYTSPKGRNHYENTLDLAISDIIPNYLDQNNSFSSQFNSFGIPKSQILRERSKLTKKLRYQVLKRDHYRCVLCGRSAKDGVKLHVDHIKPVSRGGKTELNNLRTLCADCNLGKSSSYDKNYQYAK